MQAAGSGRWRIAALALAIASSGLSLACGGSAHPAGPGAACSKDADCQTGTCVQQVCGLQDCSQIGGASLEKLEVTDMLSSSAPAANPVGAAILLMGNFATVSRICFDNHELTPQFNDGANAMIQVPAGSPIGKHTARLITVDGHVSPALTIDVTQSYSNLRVVLDSNGGPQPILGTPAPSAVFVPAPKTMVDPITNEWRDSFGSGLTWSLTGSPWDSSTSVSGSILAPDQVTTYATVSGRYDVPNKRINLTISPRTCQTTPCQPWSYVGIFSCWQPGNSTCLGFDPCTDVRDPNDPQSVSDWSGPYRRDLVLFPVGDADPQGVLRVGTCS